MKPKIITLLSVSLFIGHMVWGQCATNYSGVTTNGANCGGDGCMTFTFDIADIDANSDGTIQVSEVPAVAITGIVEDGGTDARDETYDGSGSSIDLVAYDVGLSSAGSNIVYNGDGTVTIEYYFDCDKGADSDCPNNSNMPNGAVNTNDILIFSFGSTVDCEYPLDGGNDLNAVSAPVELTTFSVVWEGERASLSWETATEENTSHFLVQRMDGASGDWREIGRVEAVGFSAVTEHYEFVDEYPSHENYYRLKIVDFDDTYEYSGKANLSKRSSEDAVLLSPNPSKGEVNLLIQTEGGMDNARLLVADMSGRILRDVLIGDVQGGDNMNLPLDFSDLPKGMYFYSLSHERGLSTGKISIVD